MSGLNDKQLEACCYTDGPLLILAGAGSGKTRVITHRIAYLMNELSVNPYNILAITFTNKAAKEMRERVDKIVGFGAESVWISTFHSMCVRILRKHIDKIGGSSNFAIYDTDDQKIVIKESMKYLNIDPKMYPEKMVMSVISKAKEEYMTPDQYEKENATSYRGQQIANIYREYQKRLKNNNALDFDDLIFKTIFLFETNPDALAEYQERFKYIMVDEYQDTNHTQFILVKMLAAKYRNLCVVGDDDQSIYKFRGANIYNILNFENEYKEAKVVKLEQNYRSTANILNAANNVIANNEGRKDKTLWTEQDDGDKVTFTIYPNEYEEASGIVDKIRKLLKMDVDCGDIAILYRTNAQSRAIEEKLIYDNIPYKVYGGTNFYSRKEVKDILAYLKVLSNSGDDQAVKRIINVPKRGIGNTTIDKIADFAIQNEMNFYDALLDIREVPVSSKTADKIEDFVNMIEMLRSELEEDLLSTIVDRIMEITGYENMLTMENTEESKARLENIDELKNKVVYYEESIDDPNLIGLLEDIALVADVDEDDSDDKVTLMTLHSSKGLEFPYVFIGGMEERLFPSGLSLDSDDPDALEEERRLCYVGITRAMTKLYLSAAKQRMVHGTTNYSATSRFIGEIPEHYLELEGGKPMLEDSFSGNSFGSRDVFSFGSGNNFGGKNGNIGYGKSRGIKNDYGKNNPYVKSSVNPSANPGFGKAFPMDNSLSDCQYKEGDVVKHIKFGKGVVTSVVKAGSDQEITVDFERTGEKKMFASLVKMKKL